MKKVLLSAAVLAVSAGAAMASPLSATGHVQNNKFDTAPGGNMGEPRGVTNNIVAVDVAGFESWDLLSDPSNQVLAIDIAAMAGLGSGSLVTMTSIGWDVTLETVGGSWLNEARFYFDDNIAPDLSGLFLTPGFGNSFPGLMSFTSGGQIDLSDNAIPNIILPNGILRLEMNESFDDVANAIDGNWRSGALFIGIAEIPAPGATALFGLAGLAGLRRRR